MRDKVDERNRERYLRGNLIKWWNVKVESEDDDVVEEDKLDDLLSGNDNNNLGGIFNGLINQPAPQGLDEDERMLLGLIMDKSDRSDVFNSAMDEMNAEKEREANEIYERLMKEAAEDEAKKQNEIEAAKLAAAGSGN